MRLSPGQIASGDLSTVNAPEIGADKRVYVSPGEMVKMGSIAISAEDTGAYTAQAGASLPTAGRDLHLRATKRLLSPSGELAVQMNVTFADDATGTATATFKTPSWVQDQGYIVPFFAATDFVGDGGNSAKLIKTITSLAAISNGAAGGELEIWSSPAAAEFFEIGCAVNAEGPPPYPSSLAIPCRRNPAAWTKAGRAAQASLNIGWKYFDQWEGLNRYMGDRATIRIDIEKDGLVVGAREIYAGYLPSGGPSRGDGDDEVQATSEGVFENMLIFTGY